MKTFHFPQQKESDECPAVPKAVSIVADSLASATKLLAGVLKDDAKLEKEHPEFMDPSLREKNAAPVESKTKQRRNGSLDS